MIHDQYQESQVMISPLSTATNATSTGIVDTLGYEYCTIEAILDSAGAVSSNPATLKLSESTVTNYSSATDIAVFTGDDTTSGFTIPNADTDNGQIVRFNVDCRTRERYLHITITPAGAAQIVGAVARLGRPKVASVATNTPSYAAIVTG